MVELQDSESRSPGFDPHKRHRVVSLSKTNLLPTVLVKPRKHWLRTDITEKLLTGTLSLNTNKQTNSLLYVQAGELRYSSQHKRI